MSSRNIDLYLNLARPPEGVLLAGRRVEAAEPPVFIDGEKPKLRIQFLLPTGVIGEAPVVTVLGAGDEVIFALKKKAGGTLLVSGTGFALVGEANERRYEALVNFDTNELTNVFGDETVLTAIGEVRIQNAANTERKTFQFRCSVRRRIYAGEGQPISATPSFNRFPQVFWDVIGAVGGGATKLDGQTTVGVARPALIETPAFAWHRWVLRDRDPADVIDGDNIVQPVDHDDDDNDCVFVKIA